MSSTPRVVAFKKTIVERALGGELTHHLGYPPGGDKPDETRNRRNGIGSKTVLTDDGPLPLDVPRNRAGTFEPADRQPRAAVHGFGDSRAVRARGDRARQAHPADWATTD